MEKKMKNKKNTVSKQAYFTHHHIICNDKKRKSLLKKPKLRSILIQSKYLVSKNRK